MIPKPDSDRTLLELRQRNAELEQRVQERTAALNHAAAEQRRLAAIIEATSDYVGIADLQGRSVYVNGAGLRLVGKTAAEMAGADVMACYLPEEAEVTRQMVAEALQGRIWSGEVHLLRRDGVPLPVSEVTFALPDEQGRPEYLATIIRDIRAQKAAEAELRSAKEAAEAANLAKSAFLASMSHEIRTPMNAVIGMTSLLRETVLTPRQQDFVETIRASGDALLAIINDILDFSKIEAGKMELTPRPFLLRESVESVLDLLAPRAAEKGLELACLLEPDVPAALEGDMARLRQVLVNLVGNAVKFTDSGEVVVAVSSRPVETPSGPQHEIHFAVRDTGCGIPPEKTQRLFRPFSQVDNSPARAHGGTGLGLAISRRLAEIQGGRMWAESEGVPGLGATFHFTIVAPAAQAEGLRSRCCAVPELRGKRVLVVDDNATNRRILSLQLQNWGMQATEAASPAEALSLVQRQAPFDLALLDMHLPAAPGAPAGPADGIALAKVLCARAGQQRIPLVMLASVGQESPADVEALHCFEAWLTKPVKSSQLFDVIASALAPQEPGPAEPAGDSAPLLAQALPLSVLVAEDVAVNRKFIRLALEQMGYTPDLVCSGHEALDAVRRRPYDLVFMDVQMPGMDGLEATRRIRADTGLQQPYITAMTANAMLGDREMCLSAGMDDYVSKPVYLAELQSALQRAAAWRSRLVEA